jgi:hypothetical protein
MTKKTLHSPFLDGPELELPPSPDPATFRRSLPRCETSGIRPPLPRVPGKRRASPKKPNKRLHCNYYCSNKGEMNQRYEVDFTARSPKSVLFASKAARIDLGGILRLGIDTRQSRARHLDHFLPRSRYWDVFLRQGRPAVNERDDVCRTMAMHR